MTYTPPAKLPTYELDKDIELDYYHPGNHEFIMDLEAIKKAIVAQAMTMKTWHNQAVRRRMAGNTNIEIAEEFGKTAGGVSSFLNSEPALRLRQLLQHHQVALDGPSEALRRRILWEVVVDNQRTEPKTAISAVQELNRMEGTYDKAKSDPGTGNTIIINNSMFPKGKLDGG